MSRDQVLEKMCEPNTSTIYETAWGKCYKKALFENIKYPVGMIHEDTATTYKLVLKCQKIVFIDSPLYFYRSREGSITAKYGKSNNIDICTILVERDNLFSKSCSRTISEENRLYSLNVLMRAYYGCDDKKAAEAFLTTYRSLYSKGITTLDRRSRGRAFIQRWVPALCRYVYLETHRTSSRMNLDGSYR